MKVEAAEREELEAVLADAAVGVGHARRVRVILLSAEGVAAREIASRLSLSAGQVSRIRGRFERGRVKALADRPRVGRKDHAVSLEKVELILSLVTSEPPVGRIRWSTRLIGARVGLSSATVAKVLRTTRRDAGASPASASPE